MKLFSAASAAALTIGLCLVGAAVRAQTTPFLDLSVTPATQTVAPGAAPLWNIQLTNPAANTDAAFFALVGFDDGLGVVPDVSVGPYDPAPFGQQITLAPGESVTFPNFFQTVVSPTAGSAAYASLAEATYDLYDGAGFADVIAGGVVASSEWTLNVQGSAAAPEPGAISLLALPALLLAARCRLRRATERGDLPLS